MKKIFLVGTMFLAFLASHAQDNPSVTIDTRSEVAEGSLIRAKATYTAFTADDQASSYTWSIAPCDEDGRVTGDELYSETFQGTPLEEFEFPGSADYPHGDHYRIGIQVANLSGQLAAASAAVVSASQAFGIFGRHSITVAPGVNMTTHDHIYTPGSGSATLTITNSGSNLVSNFQVFINGQAFSNGSHPSFSSPQPLSFTFNIPPNVPTCASAEVFVIKITSGSSSVTFPYMIICESDSKQTVLSMNAGIFYKGDDKQLHKIAWNGSSWVYQAIIPLNWPGVEVDGWLCGSAAANFVYFKGTDGRIYSYDMNTNMLAMVTGVTDVKSNLQLRNNSELLYIGTDDHVHSIRYTGGWAVSPMPPWGGYGSTIAAGGLAYENVAGGNIFFRDANNAIVELYFSFNDANWHLAALPSGPGCDGDMIYDTPGKSVYFRGADNFVHRTSWSQSSGWVYDPMTSNAPITATNDLAHLQGTDNLVFKSSNNHLYSITRQPNGSWHTDWLDGTYNHVEGDLVEDWTHIFFVSSSKQIGCYFWNSPNWTISQLGSGPSNAVGCSIYYRYGQQQEEESTSQNTNVFPNPSNGSFEVSFSVPVEHAQAELYNLMGERVDAFTINGTEYKYASASLADGVYLLRINDKGTITTRQIVIH